MNIYFRGNENLSGDEPRVSDSQRGSASGTSQTTATTTVAIDNTENTSTFTGGRPHSPTHLARNHSTIAGKSVSKFNRVGASTRSSTVPAAHSDMDSGVGGVPSNRSRNEVDNDSPTEVDHEMATGEVDFDNFEEFDGNTDCLDGVEEMDESFDIPGDDEWTEEPAGNEATSFSARCRTSCSEISHLHSHSNLKIEAVVPKSKMSLRQQKSAKLRVSEMGSDSREMQCVRNPPVASVKPIQLQIPQPSGEQQTSSCTDVLTEAELYGEPVLVESVSDVEDNSWKIQPFLKIMVEYKLLVCVSTLTVFQFCMLRLLLLTVTAGTFCPCV